MQGVQTTHDNWAQELLETFFPAAGKGGAAQQDRAENGTAK
jgi:hypothetical protein